MWKDSCLASWILSCVKAKILKYRSQRHLLHHFEISLVYLKFYMIEKN